MYLKFFLSCLLGSCLLVTACKQEDQKLISKIENDIQSWQSELTKYEAVGANIEKFRRDLDVAFPDQAYAPADSLKTTANALVNREKAAIAAYKEYVSSLTKGVADYKTGAIKKEELELQHKAVEVSLRNMGQTFRKMEVEYKQQQAELAARQK